MSGSSTGTAGSVPPAGSQGAGGIYDNTRATIHVTTAGAYIDEPVYEVEGTAAGLGFPVVDTYDNGALNGGGGVYNGVWSSIITLVPGDNVITAGPEIGSGAASDNAVDLFYEPASYRPGYGDPVNVAVDQAGGNTDSAAQTLSGTVSSAEFGTRLVAGTTLTLSDDGTVLGHATVGTDGTWKAQVTLPGQGDNAVAVSDVDLAGNTGEAIVAFRLKTSVPAVAITSAGGTVGQARQVISGTATAGDVGDAITLSDDGTAIGTAAVGPDGTWSMVTTLHEGSNAFQATDADPYGNVGISDAVSYNLDTTPPGVAITSGATSTRAASDTETVTGTAEVGSAVTLFDDGAPVAGPTVGADGTWSAQVALHAGPNGVSAQATDAAGNVGYSGTIVDTLDTTPVAPPADPAPTGDVPPQQPAPSPSISITSAGGLTNQAAATVSGQATAGSTVALFDDGNPVWSTTAAADGSWSLGLTLSQGANILTATDTTAAGTAAGDPVAATLDDTPPSVGFGPAPQLGGTTATLTGTASDAGGIRGVEIYDGSTDLGAAQVNGDGGWTFSHDFGQGSYDHLAAVATDAAGNSAVAAALYGLDTVPSAGRSAGEVTTFDAGGAVTSVTTMSADGSVGAQTVSNGDGTATGTGYESGQSLFSIGGDVMTGNGFRQDFVFQPTMGHARITDFVAGGPGHDTITLSHQDFAGVAQVLNNTTMNHGSALIHVSPDDTIRLAGVTRAELAGHRGDFAFTD